MWTVNFDIKIPEDKHLSVFNFTESFQNFLIFTTFGEGGRFSSSENEGERGFRRRRVGLGVAGGEGDGVVGWDFPNDCSESSWRSSCSSEPESSLRESSSSRSSSSPLPCGAKGSNNNNNQSIYIFKLSLGRTWRKQCGFKNDTNDSSFNISLNEENMSVTCGDPAGVLSTEAEERLFLWTKSCFLLFLLLPLLFTPPSRLEWPPGGRPTRLLFFFP